MSYLLPFLYTVLIGEPTPATLLPANAQPKLECSIVQTAPPDTIAGKVLIVNIYPAAKERRQARFLTGGQAVAGLDEAKLNARFAKAPSTPYILNFLVVNGYRVIGFERVPEGAILGIAEPTQGYTYLLEKVR